MCEPIPFEPATPPKPWGQPTTLDDPATGRAYHGRIRCGIAIIEVIQAADLPHLTTWVVFDDTTRTALGVGFSRAEAERFADEVIDRFAIDTTDGHRFMLHAFDATELTRTIGELANRHGITSQRAAAQWVANGGAWIEENEGAEG